MLNIKMVQRVRSRWHRGMCTSARGCLFTQPLDPTPSAASVAVIHLPGWFDGNNNNHNRPRAEWGSQREELPQQWGSFCWNWEWSNSHFKEKSAFGSEVISSSNSECISNVVCYYILINNKVLLYKVFLQLHLNIIGYH